MKKFVVIVAIMGLFAFENAAKAQVKIGYINVENVLSLSLIHI